MERLPSLLPIFVKHFFEDGDRFVPDGNVHVSDVGNYPVKRNAKRMFSDHWSSCALHSGPARWPMPCSCGGIKGDTPPDQSCRPTDYSQAEVLRRFGQLWKARLIWKRENHASLGLFLTTAMRSGSGRRR